MNDKQPEALRQAAEFERLALDHAPSGWPAIQQRELTNAAITLRAQHAAIERKDALLRKALEAMRRAVDDDHLMSAVVAMAEITKELQ